MTDKRNEGADRRGWFVSLDLERLRCPPAWVESTVSSFTLVAIVISVPAAALVIGWLIVLFLQGLINPSDSFEAARNLGLILAAAIGLPFRVWRSWIGERQARAALCQAAAAEENVVTNSFTRAIEQLGAMRNVKDAGGQERTIPNIEVRLGALYSLERLYNSSKKDQAAVAEIIAAYVQEHGKQAAAPVHLAPTYGGIDPCRKWAEIGERIRKRPPPRADVQAALSVLLRSCTSRVGSPSRSVEWWQLDATRADFRSAMRPDLDLRGAGMIVALLADADMRRCDLRRANLSGATMWNVDLGSAILNSTDLEAAILSNANMNGVLLINSRLSGADLCLCKLDNAHLNGAQMECVNLKGASLVRAVLSGVILRNADVSRASFRDAIVWGVDFSDVRGLTQEQIDSIWEGDANTKLPDQLEGQPVKRPRHWLPREINGQEILERLELHRAGRPPSGREIQA